MADVSKLRLDNVTYDIKDDNARKYLVMVNEEPVGATKMVVRTSGDAIELAYQKDLDGLSARVCRTYPTVQDMVQDTSLKLNDIVQCSGYYSMASWNSSFPKFIIMSQSGFPLTHSVELNNGLYADLIISDVINVKDFGAYGDGTHNDTVAFQNALYVAKMRKDWGFEEKTQIVYAPSGKYLINNNLEIPSGITLKGDKPNTTDETAQGSWFYIDDIGLESFDERVTDARSYGIINLVGNGSTIDGFGIYYPNQNYDSEKDTFVEYRFSISVNSVSHATVQNIVCINPFRFLFVAQQHSLLTVKNIIGAPILDGIYCIYSVHTDDFINITFHQVYYSLKISTAAYKWVQKRNRSIVIIGSDWGRMENVFIYGSNIGIKLGCFNYDIGNGINYHGCRNFDLHSVKIEETDTYGVLIDNPGASYEVANSGGGITFESCVIQMRGDGSAYSNASACVGITTCADVRFYNTSFSCTCNCIEAIDGTNNTVKNLLFNGCYFWNYGSDTTNPIRYAIGATAKNVQIIGCYFEGLNRAVGVIYATGDKISTILITGNIISRSLNNRSIYYLNNTSSTRINIRNNVYDNVSANTLTRVSTNHHGTWEDNVNGHYVESFA